MIEEKVIKYFFRKAEIGEWEHLTIKEAEKKLKVRSSKIKELFIEKEYFLIFYLSFIDKKVLLSVTKEDFDISKPEEILQEYLMNKFEYMNQYKLAISNIVNFYIRNPNFLLIFLKSNKNSIEKLLKQFSISNNVLKKKILTKSILTIWLLAFKKWLYESDENSSSFAILDKGFKRLKKSTNLLDILLKE